MTVSTHVISVIQTTSHFTIQTKHVRINQIFIGHVVFKLQLIGTHANIHLIYPNNQHENNLLGYDKRQLQHVTYDVPGCNKSGLRCPGLVRKGGSFVPAIWPKRGVKTAAHTCIQTISEYPPPREWITNYWKLHHSEYQSSGIRTIR